MRDELKDTMVSGCIQSSEGWVAYKAQAILILALQFFNLLSFFARFPAPGPVPFPPSVSLAVLNFPPSFQPLSFPGGFHTFLLTCNHVLQSLLNCDCRFGVLGTGACTRDSCPRSRCCWHSQARRRSATQCREPLWKDQCRCHHRHFDPGRRWG